MGTTVSVGGKSRADPFEVLPHPGGAGEDADGAESQEGSSGAGAGSQHQRQELRGGSRWAGFVQSASGDNRLGACLPGCKRSGTSQGKLRHSAWGLPGCSSEDTYGGSMLAVLEKGGLIWGQPQSGDSLAMFTAQ